MVKQKTTGFSITMLNGMISIYSDRYKRLKGPLNQKKTQWGIKMNADGKYGHNSGGQTSIKRINYFHAL